jgi:hypothetical protein
VKVGDLVKQRAMARIGLITEAEADGRIGHYRVLWPDGECWWVHKKILKVISASR